MKGYLHIILAVCLSAHPQDERACLWVHCLTVSTNQNKHYSHPLCHGLFLLSESPLWPVIYLLLIQEGQAVDGELARQPKYAYTWSLTHDWKQRPFSWLDLVKDLWWRKGSVCGEVSSLWEMSCCCWVGSLQRDVARPRPSCVNGGLKIENFMLIVWALGSWTDLTPNPSILICYRCLQSVRILERLRRRKGAITWPVTSRFSTVRRAPGCTVFWFLLL